MRVHKGVEDIHVSYTCRCAEPVKVGFTEVKNTGMSWSQLYVGYEKIKVHRGGRHQNIMLFISVTSRS